MNPYSLIFFTALVTALIATPVFRWLSKKTGVVAVPGGRRQHQGRIAKLGGGALITAFLIGIWLVYRLVPPTNPADLLRLRGVLLGTLVITAGGLIDDWFDLAAWQQFLIQFIAAAIGMGHIIFIEVFTNPLSGAEIWLWRPAALLLTLFWIMGMINTVNWLDGLDGLAAGVGTIAALLFAWHSYRLGQETVALFPLVLAAVLLGFLPYNFSPASIFLGSAGSYFLGYTLSVLSILAPAKIATALLVLAIPILDVAWQIADRLYQGKRPWEGDRGHLHFRLADRGWPTPRIVLLYYSLAAGLGLIAIFAGGTVKLTLLLVAVGATLLLLLWYWRKKTPPVGGVQVDD